MAEFPDLILSTGKSKKRGAVSLTGSGLADSKLVFTGAKTPKPVELALSDMSQLRWMEVGKGFTEGAFALKMCLRGSTFVKLTGFHASAYNALHAWFAAAEKELLVEKVSTKGANWGMMRVEPHRVLFEDKDSLVLFDVPVLTIAQTVVQGKGEVAIEFPQDDDPKSQQSQMETLCEIRVFVPNDEREKEIAANKAAKAAAKEEGMDVAVKTEDGEESKDGEEDDEEGEEDEDTAAQLLVKEIMSRTGADELAAAPIARFSLMFQSPRGKYNVDLYPTYLKLHSKTFQYKILYKFIQKMFLLHCPQTLQQFFIIGLNPPVRQGRTPYPYLLVQFDEKEEADYQFNIDEKTCVETYKDIMQPHMAGKLHDVVTRVFKALTDRKVLVPGPEYQSRGGGACVRCNLKANDGYLYVMEKSFFFVKKPLLHLKHADITEVSFRRVSNSASGSKTFDLHLITNEEKNNEYIFSSIQRDEYEPLFAYLRKKKLNMNSDATSSSLTTGASGRVRSAIASYDEDIDPGMARAEAGSDDSSEDEDFEGGDSSSSSESDSDMPEEASDEDVGPSKKKKRSSRNDESEEEEEEDEEAPAKKKGGAKRKRGEAKEKGPKRAKSAYFHYLDVARPKYIADHPELKGEMIKVTQALAAQWKALDAEERRPYEQQAEQSKADLAASRGDDEDAAPKKKRGGKGKSSSGAPKKPKSAYTLWQEQQGKSELKAAEPSLPASEIKSKLAEQWKAMTEEQQQPFKEQVLAAKRKYKAELAEWQAAHPEGEDGGDADGEDDMKDTEEGEAAKSSKKHKKSKKNKKDKSKKEKKSKKDKKKSRKESAASDDSGDEEDTAVKSEPMEE